MFSFWIVLFIIVLPFAAVVLFRGAPFVPVKNRDLEEMLDSLDIEDGELFVDYGSGNGAVVRAAAQRGAQAIGYEMNPFLILIARLGRRSSTGSATYQFCNMWNVTVPVGTRYIYTFLLPKHIDAFIHKIRSEIMLPTLFISYTFPLEGVEPLHVAGNCFIYELTPLEKPSKKK